MKEEIRKEVMKVFDQEDSVDNVVDNILHLFDVSWRSEQLPPKYIPCGGCGADNPIDRCINCRHHFGGN
jgi:hypothetical protein